MRENTWLSRLFGKQNLIGALPGAIFLALGFLLPLLWWPTSRVGLALLLYFPLLCLTIWSVLYLVAIQRPTVTFFVKTTLVLIGLFAAFLIYILRYRAVCL